MRSRASSSGVAPRCAVEHNVDHVTTFRYGGAVRDSVNEVRLRPRTDALQVCLDFRLTTSPPTEVRTYTDYFDNTVQTFDIEESHTTLLVVARSRVTTHAPEVPDVLPSLPDRYRPLPLEDARRPARKSPIRHRAVRVFDVDVKPDVWVAPLDSSDRAGHLHGLRQVVLRDR